MDERDLMRRLQLWEVTRDGRGRQTRRSASLEEEFVAAPDTRNHDWHANDDSQPCLAQKSTGRTRAHAISADVLAVCATGPGVTGSGRTWA